MREVSKMKADYVFVYHTKLYVSLFFYKLISMNMWFLRWPHLVPKFDGRTKLTRFDTSSALTLVLRSDIPRQIFGFPILTNIRCKKKRDLGKVRNTYLGLSVTIPRAWPKRANT